MDELRSKEKIEVVLKNETPVEDGTEISLREILEALIKGKKLIAIILILALLSGIAANSIMTPYKGIAKAIISFNFDGIEKGLDPYGKKFDLSKIKAPIVINKVVENMELQQYGITVDTIRRNIEFEPIVPGDVVNKIKILKESAQKDKEAIERLEEYSYYPNEFVIKLNMPKDWKVSKSKGQEILNSIIDSYSEYFNYTYSDQELLANAVGTLNYEDYDYPEISLVMNNQINIIMSYLQKKSKEAPDFRSGETGLTFRDIMESVSIINNVDLNRMDSIIGAFKLTKDKEKLIKSLEYRIKRYELSKEKQMDESKITSEALDKFQKEKNILLIPGGLNSTLGTMETEKTNPLYNKFAEQSVDTGVSAADIQHEIEYIRKEIALFQSEDDISVEQKKMAEQEVLLQIDKIKNKLSSWIDLTNTTVKEYYEVNLYKDAIMKLTPVQVYSANDKKMLNMAIALVLGLFIGIFAALLREYWIKSGNELMAKADSIKTVLKQ